MRCAACFLALFGLTAAPDPFLSRLSEEAEAFRSVAPHTFAQETWRHRAAVAVSRYRVRGAKGAGKAGYAYLGREIVSEYGFAALADTSADGEPSIHELREIVSVDGRPVSGVEEARRSLTLGLLSPDDHIRKRMLETLRQVGIIEPAVDFGQLLLLFTRRSLGEFRFQAAGDALIGAERAVVYQFEQIRGKEAFSNFRGREMQTARIRGEIWSRREDLRPQRIRMETIPENPRDRRDVAVVEYAMTRHGIVLPTSVWHQAWEAGMLVAENMYSYSAFRRYVADVKVNFTEAPLHLQP